MPSPPKHIEVVHVYGLLAPAGKMSDAARGRTFSDSTRAKMSAAAKARCAHMKDA